MKQKLYLVDLWVFRRTKRPVDKYCEITGKSNFSLARILLYLSTASIISSVFLYEDITVFWFVLNIVIWIADQIYTNYQFNKAEFKLKYLCENETIDTELLRLVVLFGEHRRWFGGWFILFLVFAPLMSSGIEMFIIGLALRSLSYYVASYVQLGGKSVYQRIKEKLKATVKKYKPSIPDLSPSPIPA